MSSASVKVQGSFCTGGEAWSHSLACNKWKVSKWLSSSRICPKRLSHSCDGSRKVGDSPRLKYHDCSGTAFHGHSTSTGAGKGRLGQQGLARWGTPLVSKQTPSPSPSPSSRFASSTLRAFPGALGFLWPGLAEPGQAQPEPATLGILSLIAFVRAPVYSVRPGCISSISEASRLREASLVKIVAMVQLRQSCKAIPPNACVLRRS